MPVIHKCSECGGSVIVDGEEIARTCDHDEAAIVAEMEAVAYGISSLED